LSIVSPQVLPQAAVRLELSDEEAVERNFTPAERPTGAAARKGTREREREGERAYVGVRRLGLTRFDERGKAAGNGEMGRYR